MRSWITDRMKRRDTIYIIPTKMGGYLNGLIVLMFLLSIGYSNNLLLIFTLFLFGFNLLWVIQTHFYLHALKIGELHINDGHVHESLSLKISWKGTPIGAHDWQLALIGDNENVPIKVLENLENLTSGEIELNRRGSWQWNLLKISTEKPYGLYQVFRYERVQAQCLAYPELIKEGTTPLLHNSALEGEFSCGQKGTGDFHTLGAYQGDGARLISWKHYARTGELLIKEGERHESSMARFELLLPFKNNENLLSVMATQMVLCHREEISFLLKTPTREIGPAHHGEHLHECLRELALW